MKKYRKDGRISSEYYFEVLNQLQEELVELQEWVKLKGLRVVVIFEGRDAAGKGGTIKRITQRLNPRVVRLVALGVPTERERGQWYFQRYVPHLPAAGEIVLFDRSWYNRAGVEKVMGFCTDDEYREFLKSCPEFERMLVRSGIVLIKYWFSVSAEEQERRFQARMQDPKKRWKISPMDEESRQRWVDYSKAKDAMLTYTDIQQAPWYLVDADVKKHARLNCITHLLSRIPYDKVLIPERKLAPREVVETDYDRPDPTKQHWVPEVYGGGKKSEEELQFLLEERRKALERVTELEDELQSTIRVGEKIAAKDNGKKDDGKKDDGKKGDGKKDDGKKGDGKKGDEESNDKDSDKKDD
jgi:polyphosphate kinase 2